MKSETLTGILLDERTELSLHEFCDACSSSTDWVVELVEEGVLEPAGRDQAQWRFSGLSLFRARTAMRLQHDLDINLAGIALALELMDELESLRERLYRIDAPNRPAID